MKRRVVAFGVALTMLLPAVTGCRRKPELTQSSSPPRAGRPVPEAPAKPASADPRRDDGEEAHGPPPPDPAKAPPRRERWELLGPDPKKTDVWVITAEEVIQTLKLGLPEAKLREKIIHALETDHLKAPMKATAAEQAALIKAGASKELVQFLMNLPVE